MAASSWYRQGTVAVTNGSTAVAGTLTGWTNQATPGDEFVGPDGKSYEISAIAGNTAMTLVTPYTGASVSGQAYAIKRFSLAWGQSSTLAGNLAALLALLPVPGGLAEAYRQLRANSAGTGFELATLIPSGATDNALPRFDGSTGLLQKSGIIVSDSDDLTVPGQLSGKGAKNDIAPAPDTIGADGVGRRDYPNRVALTSSTGLTIASCALTGGDYSVTGVINFDKAASTVIYYQIASLSLVANTLGSLDQQVNITNLAAGAGTNSLVIPSQTLRIPAAGATLYLVAQAAFTTDFVKAFGTVFWERKR